ncbi:hypothetical protein [uncultured Robinsoniella sp.]|uniref:hypothetical protein n=1 Tax=uncultured Robinsoniella sp. TaxID=904190 RepID=UPI00374EBB82
MAKYNLNDVALHNVKNHIFVKNAECNTARIKAIKDGKIDSEIKMWTDMQVIYGMLMEQLNQLN